MAPRRPAVMLWATAPAMVGLAMTTVLVAWPGTVPRSSSRVSVSTPGSQGNGDSFQPSISDDGRYVAFTSAADNLDSRDTPPPADPEIHGYDVFVRDLHTGKTEPISLAGPIPSGFGDRDSFAPSISGDGRSVVFESAANNLGVPDGKSHRDVFLHERHTHKTSLVSVGSNGLQANGASHLRVEAKTLRPNTVVSDSGRYVVFQSDATNLINTFAGDQNGKVDVFVRDRLLNKTRLVSVPSGPNLFLPPSNGDSINPAISGDGRYVAFSSSADNLVDGDTNDSPDVFVHDLTTGQTTRVSLASDRGQAAFTEDGCGTLRGCHAESISLSDDGRYVAFDSFADNLAPGDTPYEDDVFVHDRWAETTVLASVGTDGQSGTGPARKAKFQSAMSDDGRFVTFESDKVNLVGYDNNDVVDVFVRDLRHARTMRVSVAAARTERCPKLKSGACSGQPAIDATGRAVAYLSSAQNLVNGDTNGCDDIFVSAP